MEDNNVTVAAVNPSSTSGTQGGQSTQANPQRGGASANRGRGRGGRSDQRSQNWRRQKGTEIARQAREEIIARHTAPLAEYFAQMEITKSGGTDTAIPVPTTTRGIGLNTSLIWDHAEHNARQAIDRSGCTIFQLYRHSLLQLSIQLFNGYSKREEYPDYATEFNDVQFVPADHISASSSTLKNFSLVADGVSSVGRFTHSDTEYFCYVPKLQVEELGIDEEPSTSTKRRAIARNRALPNPYLVTIQNLRETVQYLADRRTDADRRRAFRALNPIPGAIWNEESVLQNADEIMPRNYDSRVISRDASSVGALINNIKHKDQFYVRELTLSGIGHPCSLVWTRSPNDEAWNFEEGSTRIEIREPMILGPTFWPTAGCILLSELPLNYEGLDLREEPDIWALRSPWISKRYLQSKWLDLALKVIEYVPKKTG